MSAQQPDTARGVGVGELKAYMQPDEPGAPQPGDLVVVAIDARPGDEDLGLLGHVGLLYKTSRMGIYPWLVKGLREDPPVDYVHAVRWPTEAELAAYQLGAGGQS